MGVNSVFFEVNENGKIMICAEEKIKPNMTELLPPSEFIPEEMHNWRVADGTFVYSPKPAPPTVPTHADRIAALEEELAAAKILLGVE